MASHAFQEFTSWKVGVLHLEKFAIRSEPATWEIWEQRRVGWKSMVLKER